ncbi:hypothetical protein PHLGIDRAFT_22644 [Phlebiopsis gigantea 11061_1 CR5-6]|uniref:Phytase A n=1 Tax=Phlebiopsis gigantea (strain 11061_1 CR5-6) TaxID=745531 RepID=A0A0C3SDP7_PHLG1|nr:hypothetical protein PHLGIDRAFT_22644 [Phlebiopsis gigantea 11061_1 CR5-6]
MEKAPSPVLPTVGPFISKATPSKRKSTVKGGLLAATGILSLLALSRVPQLGVPEKIQRHWGQYSPYFPVGEYAQPPPGCVIDQVNILQRHGARYPNDDDDYYKAVRRLQGAKQLKGDLKFLKDYEYTLGVDDLLAFGALQSYEAGELAHMRYSQLLTNGLPFVRASGMQRVVDTAGNWSLGFMHSNFALSSPRGEPDSPLPIQIISEERNDTLNNDCPNAPNQDYYTDQWLHRFAPPIIKKLQKMAKGAHLEDEDVKRLLDLCIFETIANAPKSAFCDLFEYQEWKDWEYWGDVEKYYKTGYGDPLGPVQGVGYINELLARLTGTPVADRTTHDAALPFPLDRALYADFTHENLMVAVYGAMGLFDVSKHLDPTRLPPDEDREWFAGRMVPFSARMVVERLSCGGGDGGGGALVRIFVNDALQPLEFCNDGDEDLAELGLCTLASFVASQGYARRSGDGDFEKCYE